jgi:hypothetical protein
MSTSIVITEAIALTPTKAPALPFAPVEYDRTYQDTFNNILRQYFNTVDNYTGQLRLGSVYAFADLPDAVVAGVGSRAFVTDSSVSTFGSNVAGGGSGKVPVYSDGTNWKVG